MFSFFVVRRSLVISLFFFASASPAFAADELESLVEEFELSDDSSGDLEDDFSLELEFSDGVDLPAAVPDQNEPDEADLLAPETSLEPELAARETDISSDPLSEISLPENPELGSLVDENLFFDSSSLSPASEMGAQGGAMKLDPVMQPASKLVVVRENAAANSLKAKLVAAERAVQLGRYDSALSIYEGVYPNHKSNPNVLLGRAIALQKLGHNEAAVRAYEALLELKPDNVEAQVNMLGLLAARYPEVTLRRLLELYQENPSHMGIVAQIAFIQGALGRYDSALEYYGIASGMQPNNASHLFNMAVIADKAGKTREAVRYYERSLELDTVYGGGRSVPRNAIFERLARLR